MFIFKFFQEIFANVRINLDNPIHKLLAYAVLLNPDKPYHSINEDATKSTLMSTFYALIFSGLAGTIGFMAFFTVVSLMNLIGQGFWDLMNNNPITSMVIFGLVMGQWIYLILEAIKRRQNGDDEEAVKENMGY